MNVRLRVGDLDGLVVGEDHRARLDVERARHDVAGAVVAVEGLQVDGARVAPL